ncbi:hypothetical protein LTR17_022032 [Elasticomyces elasticus]|nr:hypothetical protein LTR17_022032 [Elasticomyces elasticus]
MSANSTTQLEIQQQQAAAELQLHELQLQGIQDQVDRKRAELNSLRKSIKKVAPVYKSQSLVYPPNISRRDRNNINDAIYQDQKIIDILKETTNKLEDHVRVLSRLRALPIVKHPGEDVHSMYGGIEGGMRTAFSHVSEVEVMVEEIDAQLDETMTGNGGHVMAGSSHSDSDNEMED